MLIDGYHVAVRPGDLCTNNVRSFLHGVKSFEFNRVIVYDDVLHCSVLEKDESFVYIGSTSAVTVHVNVANIVSWPAWIIFARGQVWTVGAVLMNVSGVVCHAA